MECVAHESQDTDLASTGFTEDDSAWVYAYRSRYHTPSTTYDESDYDSFATAGADDLVADDSSDDSEADFSDS